MATPTSENWERALAAIRHCEETGEIRLDLSGLQLTTLPPEISRLSHLEELNLSSNELSVLPSSLAALSALQSLEISTNPLVELPSFIHEFSNLWQLDIHNCLLKTLPPEIGGLTTLRLLTISDTNLESLPSEMGLLTELIGLSLSRNHLTELPPEISLLSSLRQLFLWDNKLERLPQGFTKLTSLNYLKLGQNAFESFPLEIVALTNLIELNLSGNNISELPPEICNLGQLTTLEMAYNQLTRLPEQIGALSKITNLDFRHNLLTDLPKEILQLPALESFELEENPLPKSYLDALEQGIGAIKSLVNSFTETTQSLFEAKLLVTGEGQVGKSWALAKLQGVDPREKIGSDNTTWGIDRGELRLAHPHIPGEEILLNTWDFGGQKVYRVTHQFFFSEQAIYILVWNPRQGAEQCRVREWLRMIAVRTGSTTSSSEEKGALPPRAKVIMVATHAESEGGAYNPDYGRSNLDRDLQEMIVDEIAVDSISGKNIDTLRAMIAHHAASLPDMGQPFNMRWAAAREAVLALRQSKPWIDFEEFTNVCQSHGVSGSDQLRTLAWTYLHSLGRAIWYGSVARDDAEDDDPLLADTIVLDAVWLSRAFVQVLDDDVTQKAGGMLDHRRFPAIWTNHNRSGWHRYKPNEYEILRLVMRRFDVALPTRESQGKRSLVPQLVPYQRPSLPWTDASSASGSRTIRLSCRLDYEATGLMPRLIAATEAWHVYGGGQGLFWEEGVFLEETASFSNQALVTVQGTERPRIDVIVSGDQPAFLMHEIYKILERLLAFWKGMTKTYSIKCPTKHRDGSYCTGSFKYRAVIRRINEKINKPFNCEECDATWSADRLILGFEALAMSEKYMVGHLYHRDQLLCPRSFMLEPADRELFHVTSWAGFVGKRFKLTLLSELSGQKVASQEFSFTREWVKWVKPAARVASFFLVSAAIPVEGALATEFKEGAAMLDKLGMLPESAEAVSALDSEIDVANVRLTKQQLANFDKFLKAIKLDPRNYGMDIAQAADGRWLWMSADEVLAYTPQEAA